MNKITNSKLLYCFAMIAAVFCTSDSQSMNRNIFNNNNQHGSSESSRIGALFRVPTLQGINQITWRFDSNSETAVRSEFNRLRIMHSGLRRTVEQTLCEAENENYQHALDIFNEYFSTIQMGYTEHREEVLIFLTHQLNRIRECAVAAMNHDEIEIFHLIESNVNLLLNMYKAWKAVREVVLTSIVNPDEIAAVFEFARVGTMRPRQY